MTLIDKTDEAVIERIRARVSQTLQKGLQFETSTELAESFLRRHVHSKVKLAILYADIEGSTRMSLTIPTETMASIIQVFSQEMAMITTGYGGYILKYVGDAVIAFFPGEFDSKKACNNAVNCARSMMKAVSDGINPAFIENGLPSIEIKTGIDIGQNLIVLYGKDPANSYIDLVGSSISIAAKITAIANPGQIVIGEDVYQLLDPDLQKEFSESKLSPNVWSFDDPRTGTLYKLYATSVEIDVKDILYSVLNEMDTKRIESRIVSDPTQIPSIIQETCARCFRMLSSYRNYDTVKIRGELIEAFMHYLLTNLMIPSERKVSYDNMEIDLIIPNLKQLQTDPKRTLLIYFVKSFDENFIMQFEKLSKIQPNKYNIWLVCGCYDKMLDSYKEQPIFIYDDFANESFKPLSSIIDEIKLFVETNKIKGFRIFRS